MGDALSQKPETMGSLAYLSAVERPLALDVQDLDNQFVRFDISKRSRVISCVVSRSFLYDHIRECQYDDPHLLVLTYTVQCSDAKEVSIRVDGMLRMQGQLCVPNMDGLYEVIFQKAHCLRYSIHSGAAKMYQNLMQHYWVKRMKKDILKYVARCLNYQQLKYEHHMPGGFLQRLEIPEWKWERLTMDFINGILRTQKKFDVVWDQLCIAQSRKKRYADRKVCDVAFMVGERVLLRVSPMKCVMMFGEKEKLSPWYIEPFEILERVGEVAYKLALPLSLPAVHPMFHVSMLRKYHGDPSYVFRF
ncbi:uncharacterized protein [Nicotiana tomentosiformis]|uniref:uncharacterized protein n=1 Tax=Nicotiana tomentosiformis TaxID=4098 RepID=UPI00388C5F34